MDWNEDNKKDLILGEFNGRVRIYLNTGTDADPEFNGFSNLKVGGSQFFPELYANPWVVDWNEDGKKDMLLGYYSGLVYLLINTGTNAAPVFPSYTLIQDGAGDLDAGINSGPAVVDWNRDGKKDLLAGAQLGWIECYENIGTNAAPVFDGHVSFKLGTHFLEVGAGYSRPFPVDWNNDGIDDIIAGCVAPNFPLPGGYVLYYESFDPLQCDPATLSTGSGGTVDFDLRAGLYSTTETYILLASLSGNSPGIPLPGGHATLPLVWDSLTSLVLQLKNSGAFWDFYGAIDGSGLATAQLNSPPWPPGYEGYPIYFAFCTIYPYTFASNSVTVMTVP